MFQDAGDEDEDEAAQPHGQIDLSDGRTAGCAPIGLGASEETADVSSGDKPGPRLDPERKHKTRHQDVKDKSNCLLKLRHARIGTLAAL